MCWIFKKKTCTSTIFIRFLFFHPSVLCVCVSRVYDGWIDLIIHGRLKECCVFVFSIQGLRIYSLNAENLGLETANTTHTTHTHRHQLFDYMKTAGSHACRNAVWALHMFLKGSFSFLLLLSSRFSSSYLLVVLLLLLLRCLSEKSLTIDL